MKRIEKKADNIKFEESTNTEVKARTEILIGKFQEIAAKRRMMYMGYAPPVDVLGNPRQYPGSYVTSYGNYSLSPNSARYNGNLYSYSYFRKSQIQNNAMRYDQSLTGTDKYSKSLLRNLDVRYSKYTKSASYKHSE